MTWELQIAMKIGGEPKGQPRPRVSTRGGFARAYTPKEHPINAWKEQIALEAKRYRPKEPLSGPICVDIDCYFSRPQGHYGTGRNAKVLKPNAPKYHTCKPDRDNIEKAILDTLTKLGFWHGDEQVCDGHAPRKMYSDGDPYTVIEIYRLEAGTTNHTTSAAKAPQNGSNAQIDTTLQPTTNPNRRSRVAAGEKG